MVHALRDCSGRYCGPQSSKQRPPGVPARELNHILYGAWQQAQAALQLLLPAAIILVLKCTQSRDLTDATEGIRHVAR
jgi:hypothetical protein